MYFLFIVSFSFSLFILIWERCSNSYHNSASKNEDPIRAMKPWGSSNFIADLLYLVLSIFTFIYFVESRFCNYISYVIYINVLLNR